MLDLSQGFFAKLAARKSQVCLASSLGLALLAAPGTVGLQAKDKPEKSGKSTIAKKVDEGTRLGGLKGDKHALTPALEAAYASRETTRALKDYSATFIKLELTPKKGVVRQAMSVKFRRQPFSVYLKFTEPHEGREVIYVDGKNKGKLQVHEPSGIAKLAGTIALSPTGDEAMKENRYPITNFGLEKLLDALIVQWEGEIRHGESDVKYYPQAKVGDVECNMYEVTHPKERSHFKFMTTRLYIEKKANLPIRVEQFAFPTKSGEAPQLVEEYTYTDIKTGINLSDADFDVNNDRYGFK